VTSRPASPPPPQSSCDRGIRRDGEWTCRAASGALPRSPCVTGVATAYRSGQPMRSPTCLAAVLLVMPPAIPAQAQLPADFDQLVAGVMADHEVPGLAIAVVKDGKVVLAKGYGVRELGRPERVDEHTRFGIASNTKAFTATALALLVEDGLIEWDKPVIEYLPWFRLSDAWVTSQLSVRERLVHRSGLGLGAGDLLWWPQSTYPRREVAERLRFLPLVTSFRSAY